MIEKAHEIAQLIKRGICDLTSVEALNSTFEIVLPQTYHTGHAVVVIAEQVNGEVYVHDGGYAGMLLEESGVPVTTAIQNQIRSSIEQYGCSFSGFRVSRKCRDWTRVPFCAATVGSASRLVADYALRTEGTAQTDFRRRIIGEVENAIGSSRVRENEEILAEKGTSYRVTVVVLDAKRSKPIAFVEPISRHQAVARKFREFYDLMLTPTVTNIDRVSVYDETREEITSGDILLLQDVCHAVSFRDAAKKFDAWRVSR